MLFRRIPKGELFFITIAGVLSGFYIWNEPLKQYAKESNYPDNYRMPLNMNFLFQRSNQMAKGKPLIPTPAKFVTGITVFVASIIGYRIYVHDSLKYNRYREAEMYANYLYENYTGKRDKSTKIDPT